MYKKILTKCTVKKSIIASKIFNRQFFNYISMIFFLNVGPTLQL